MFVPVNWIAPIIPFFGWVRTVWGLGASRLGRAGLRAERVTCQALIDHFGGKMKAARCGGRFGVDHHEKGALSAPFGMSLS
jgi:hypothetical protein